MVRLTHPSPATFPPIDHPHFKAIPVVILTTSTSVSCDGRCMANPSSTKLCMPYHVSSLRSSRTVCSLLDFVPQAPPTANGPIPADQWQNATQQDANAVIESCPCPVCSRTRNTDYQTTMGTIENQDLRLPVVRIVLVYPL